MIRKTVFISCGQYTDAEKRLGKRISEIVKTSTDLEPFFAEEVHELNGLDANILHALRNCVALITVMHPRGEIKRPDGSVLVRASIWIEQEIAIAAYVQRIEKRPLPIIAFKHKSVGLEGMRPLLHLNPIEFEDDADVLTALPKYLLSWKDLKPTGIEVELKSVQAGTQEKHSIRRLEVHIVNKTDSRIGVHETELSLPSDLLKHWNSTYTNRLPSKIQGQFRFQYDQGDVGPVRPQDTERVASLDYCTRCAVDAHGGLGQIVAEMKITSCTYINGIAYPVEKTIKELAME